MVGNLKLLNLLILTSQWAIPKHSVLVSIGSMELNSTATLWFGHQFLHSFVLSQPFFESKVLNHQTVRLQTFQICCPVQWAHQDHFFLKNNSKINWANLVFFPQYCKKNNLVWAQKEFHVKTKRFAIFVSGSLSQ